MRTVICLIYNIICDNLSNVNIQNLNKCLVLKLKGDKYYVKSLLLKDYSDGVNRMFL